MIAHRRADVADLNRRARDALRALGRLGGDAARRPAARAFAVGDRVVAAATTAGSASSTATPAARRDRHGTLTVKLDRRRAGRAPRALRARRATSTTATRSPPTARRARPSTARSCSAPTSSTASGATPRSRATATEARFYVSATPTFLNAAPEPLRDADLPPRVARMLEASRAEHLALHGVEPKTSCGRCCASRSSEAASNVADIEAAIERLARRSARDALVRAWAPRRNRPRRSRTTASRASSGSTQHDRLDAELAERPDAAGRSSGVPATRSPGSTLPPSSAARTRAQRSLDRDDDLGMDLGR